MKRAAVAMVALVSALLVFSSAPASINEAPEPVERPAEPTAEAVRGHVARPVSLDEFPPSPIVPAGPDSAGPGAAAHYDDGPLYLAAPERRPQWPTTAQGVLAAADEQREGLHACLEPLRQVAPGAVSLQPVRVRIARQAQGPARVEEVHATAVQSAFRVNACLTHAFSRSHFEEPMNGSVWVDLLVELERS